MIKDFREDSEKLDLVEEDGVPYLSIFFVLLYMLLFITDRLPEAEGLERVKRYVNGIIWSYTHYYKKVKFDNSDLSGPVGNLGFGLNGQVREIEPGLNNGFTWKRFMELFKGFRSTK